MEAFLDAEIARVSGIVRWAVFGDGWKKVASSGEPGERGTAVVASFWETHERTPNSVSEGFFVTVGRGDLLQFTRPFNEREECADFGRLYWRASMTCGLGALTSSAPLAVLLRCRRRDESALTSLCGELVRDEDEYSLPTDPRWSWSDGNALSLGLLVVELGDEELLVDASRYQSRLRMATAPDM